MVEARVSDWSEQLSESRRGGFVIMQASNYDT